MQQTTASTIVLALSSGLRPGEKGHELLETFDDPLDRRVKMIRISPRGRRMISTWERLLG